MRNWLKLCKEKDRGKTRVFVESATKNMIALMQREVHKGVKTEANEGFKLAKRKII